jgi:hypothetical protein
MFVRITRLVEVTVAQLRSVIALWKAVPDKRGKQIVQGSFQGKTSLSLLLIKLVETKTNQESFCRLLSSQMI